MRCSTDAACSTQLAHAARAAACAPYARRAPMTHSLIAVCIKVVEGVRELVKPGKESDKEHIETQIEKYCAKKELDAKQKKAVRCHCFHRAVLAGRPGCARAEPPAAAPRRSVVLLHVGHQAGGFDAVRDGHAAARHLLPQAAQEEHGAVRDAVPCVAAAVARVVLSSRPPPAGASHTTGPATAAEKVDRGNTDYSKMRIKQLRNILAERGIECVGCIEKSDFVRRCKETEHMEL